MEAEGLNAKRDENAYYIKAMSLITMVIGGFLMGLGVWSSIHYDECQKLLTPPLVGFGAALFLISVIGFLGALTYNLILLWIYLAFLGFAFIVLLAFTVAGLFVVLNHDHIRHADGLRYKEYRLQDCSWWLRKMLNNNRTWEHFKGCFVAPSNCNGLLEAYRTPKEYNLDGQDLLSASCCWPPSECGYPAISGLYYNLSFEPMSSNKDCKVYKNSEAIKCFDCDSCKAGVVQYMKITWKWFLIDSVAFLFVSILLMKCACNAKRKAEKAHLRRAYIFPDEMLQQRRI